ncbi:hypothetical protein AS033_15620 [Exiguobacterium indicum]|uniref:Uncharacterized protein n=1 Tax=Exiguobacterium indicum TaxID=296995 RepID=A0A0V8GBW0_9BACL|nr:hypothetical protein [Exiguobacterium enclense]KSU47681.1 hypothetical protein AS033_15620 [Exiguobacterium enclense]SDD44450.1 hypothetical protein SAMN05216342_3182 [Exiguobacterium enclense]
MQAKRVLSGLLISSALLLVGCSENSEAKSLKQVSVKEIDQLKDSDQSNFLLVDSDSKAEFEPYVDKVKDIAEKEDVQVNLFNPFQPNGKDLENRATDEHGELKGGRLYKLENGKLVRSLDLTALDDKAIEDEVTSFID